MAHVNDPNPQQPIHKPQPKEKQPAKTNEERSADYQPLEDGEKDPVNATASNPGAEEIQKRDIREGEIDRPSPRPHRNREHIGKQLAKMGLGGDRANCLGQALENVDCAIQTLKQNEALDKGSLTRIDEHLDALMDRINGVKIGFLKQIVLGFIDFLGLFLKSFRQSAVEFRRSLTIEQRNNFFESLAVLTETIRGSDPAQFLQSLRDRVGSGQALTEDQLPIMESILVENG